MYAWFKQNLPIKKKLLTALLVQFAAMLGMISLIYCADQQLLDKRALGALAGGLLVALAGLVIAMHRAMSNPYVATVVRMEALAAGDVTSPIQFTNYRDCVGRMTKAMHSFQAAAQARSAAEEQANILRGNAAIEGVRLDAERAAITEQQRIVVEGLAAGLGRLAEGDLACTLEQPFAPEYERLRGDFNRTVDQLRGVLNAIIANTNAIQSGTGEIAQASDDLSRRTEQQAASLEETAAALDEITATIRLTAGNSAQAQTAVSAAKLDAEHTSELVHNAVAAMSKIEGSSRQIGQIIGVIDEMAFQTNLLALNAGVEAARAGDAGRGFAVVASEVRALAQRSAEASKEIKGLVYASDEQVKAGVSLVGEAGKALSRIIQQVTDINKLVTDIAGSASEQAAGLAQINTAVNQMDQVTQQNAAMVEQATAAAHSLTQETDELGRLTARFQVGAPPANAPKGVATRQSPSKVVSLASAAPRQRVAVNTAGWEEF